MTDEQLRDLYQSAQATAGATPRSACPDPGDLAGIVDGSITNAGRIELLRHVASCLQCRAELDDLRAVAHALEKVAQDAVHPSRIPGVVSFDRKALAIAASLVLAIGLSTWSISNYGAADIDRMRSDVRNIAVVSPISDSKVRGTFQLAWRSVPGAFRYTISVLDSTGRQVYSATTADTAVTVSESTFRGESGTYRWWVSASANEATWRSQVHQFIVAQP